MPIISKFFGIIVYLYWKDHAPPHFHAKYGDEEIKDLELAEQKKALFPIKPLE
jgi:Domain of unknown function (DUF4160)